MAGLTLLRLETSPKVQTRSDALSEWLPQNQVSVYKGSVGGRVPAVVTACSARLASALSAGAPPEYDPAHGFLGRLHNWSRMEKRFLSFAS